MIVFGLRLPNEAAVAAGVFAYCVPVYIRHNGNPVYYAAILTLEPVGSDWDGTVKPIHELGGEG